MINYLQELQNNIWSYQMDWIDNMDDELS